MKPAKFTLYPDLCPAGYDLVPTGAQQGGLECQCAQNNQLIINCENNQDLVLVEVKLMLTLTDLVRRIKFCAAITGRLLGSCCSGYSQSSL